ncbi:MAG TPA: SpoIID/LytB domain-containing protein [Solirubrobacterales bacterium]|nr:SpoIID/LytB domain-containing protein [Solirubrobacterales bacterium]
MGRRSSNRLALAAVIAALTAPAQTQAADWVIEGRGFGHGVGMSQYGAFGLAEHGRDYRQILHRYYTDVSISQAGTKSVRVLLGTGHSSIGFSGAKKACGKNINGNESYSFRIASGNVTLRRPNGSKLKSCGDEGAASGGASVVFNGVGVYRGALLARNVGGSLYSINKVGIEGYIQGVIPNESPASWPQPALRAQAVAARSYALATTVSGNGYDLYDDTRSQVYGGKSSETQSTNQAAKATSREVIKSGGEVATAFFFSTSGGQTENSEFGFPGGGTPRPYLKSVNDPYDDVSPHHRWRASLTQSEIESDLSGLFSGNLKKIKVLRRGESPRIVRARVVGSSGSTEVNGDTLRFRLGLRSTWARFKKR